MKTSEAIKKFEEFLTVKGRDPVTTNCYYSNLMMLCGYLGDPDVRDISRAMMIEFFLDISKRCLPATVNKIKSAARQFYKYLLEEDLIVKSPVNGLGNAKIVRKSPPSLTEEEINRLFEYLTKPGKERERFMFEFILNTGLRISEFCASDVSSVDDKDVIEVVGKGKKVRIVPLSKKVKQGIKNYFKWREQLKINSQALMVNNNGRRLTRRGALLLWKNCLKSAGIGRNLRLHDLRHTFGTLAYKRSRDLRAVQELLGHASPQTTQIYTHIDREDLRRIVETL